MWHIAMAGGAGQSEMLLQGGMMLFILAMFYLLLIYPQQKEQKKLADLRDALRPGDPIIFCGGIHGSVLEVKEETVKVKIATNVTMTIQKTAVESKLSASDKV